MPPSENPMRQDDSASLSWLAFQYVNEELSPLEAEAFEERLACDQAAREAVAEAVLLCQAVAAGEKVELPAQRRTWLWPASWAAVGAAACLAVSMLIPPDSREPDQHAAQTSAADAASADLALIWAQSGVLDEMSLMEPVDEDLGLVGGVRELDPSVDVPAWMLEALYGGEDSVPIMNES